MSIITVPAQTAAAIQIQNGIVNLETIMVNSLNSWFRQIWANTNSSLTPPAMWAALGTNAVAVRTLWSASVSFLNGLSAGTVTASESEYVGAASGQYTMTNNEDGSVTCTLNP